MSLQVCPRCGRNLKPPLPSGEQFCSCGWITKPSQKQSFRKDFTKLELAIISCLAVFIVVFIFTWWPNSLYVLLTGGVLAGVGFLIYFDRLFSRAFKKFDPSLIQTIEDLYQHLQENPNDIEVTEQLLSSLGKLYTSAIVDKRSASALVEYMRRVGLWLLQVNIKNAAIRQRIFSIAPVAISEIFYDTALELLELNSHVVGLKQFVLDVGRWHYSNLRKDGKLTIYDEQAIQNDILARSK